MGLPGHDRDPRPWVRAVLAGVGILLTGCATTSQSSQQFRRYFVPPAPAAPETQTIDPPAVTLAYFDHETPNFTPSIPVVSRPTDTDFLIKRSEDRFAAGRRAHQEGRFDEARRNFDQALAILMTAPENVTDRVRLERRIETLAEAIYRYDVDAHLAGEPEQETLVESSPLEGILNMTFPVDPSLRNKVQEQIRVTASQLPLQESDAVDSYINFFSSTRGKKIIIAGLRRSGRYKGMIERILADEGIPQELIFLAQAESGFAPRAVSRAKCVGIWQFAAFRGKEYGLTQSAATDDRMDPERATRAAARHLHDLYEHFGDWYLAMAAYNCGPGCVDRAIQRTGFADYWQLRRLNVLPKETANYVPAILAMTIMAKNGKDYGLDDVDFDPSLEYETIELESPTHLALIAAATDRTISELRDLNPSLTRLVAPAGHALHVPKGSLEPLQAALRAVPASRRDTWRLHRVEDGDTFAEIARRFNSSPGAVAEANYGELPDAGSWMAVPVSYPGEKLAPKPAAASAKSRSKGAAPARKVSAGKPPVKRAATQAPSKAKPAVPRSASTVAKSAAPRS